MSEVGGAVGGDFGQPQAAWDVSVPEFDGADDEHLAVVAASLPSGGIVFGPEWKAGLVDFHQARQRVALGVDHAGAQLVGEQPSAAVRADTELFLELRWPEALATGGRPLQGRCRGVGQVGRIMTSSEDDAGFNEWSMMERELSLHEIWGID